MTAPNGVSESAFDVVRTTTATPAVVFIGHLGWRPNVDAAHWLVRSVWPAVTRRRPTAELQLIGRSPAKSLLKYDGIDGISVHPDVPSTLPYLGAAAVATAPLRAAGGTRLKILEAMATGTPVVATSLGALGLEHLVRRRAMAIADDPDDFAESLVRSIESRSDPEFVRQLVDPYRWRLALQPLVDVLTEETDMAIPTSEKSDSAQQEKTTTRDYEVVVVTYHSGDELAGLLSSAREDQRIAVVDNSSGVDGTREIVDKFREGRWLDGRNSGFAKAANLGARTSDAEYLICGS